MKKRRKKEKEREKKKEKEEKRKNGKEKKKITLGILSKLDNELITFYDPNHL